MAKDLPYFKFFCSEWSDGDITLEDFETQGLFINICAYYWSNECIVSLDKVKKKFKLCSEKCFDNLIKSGIIKVIDGNLSINFLNEQKSERASKSMVNSYNGKKGGRPKKQIESEKKPNALFSESETKAKQKAIREEKRREDKIREDKIKDINTASPFKFFDSLLSYGFDKELCYDWLKVRKTKKATNTKTAFNKFIIEVEKCSLDKNKILETCIEKSWSGFKSEWITNLNINFDKKITNEQFTNITAEIRRNNPNI
mgnify:CR=1 FL=1